MAKNKTTEIESSVAEFIHNIDNEAKRNDSLELIQIFKSVSGYEPKMWGPSIIGFGSYYYKYNSGHEGDAPLTGFSPRKDAISLYFSLEPEVRDTLLQNLSKHKTGKACVYIKKLTDIDQQVLRELIRASIAYLSSKYLR